MFAVALASKVKGPVAFALVAIPMRELRFHVSKPQWSSMSAKNMRQARASGSHMTDPPQLEEFVRRRPISPVAARTLSTVQFAPDQCALHTQRPDTHSPA